MRKCPYCGKENADDAKVCVKCKAAIENFKNKNENKEETNNGK